MLNNQNIIKKLEGLRDIQPDFQYARHSRRLILSSKSVYLKTGNIFSEVTRSLSFAFETALVAALFLVVILGGIFSISKSFFLPPLQGIDEEALISEANALNQDINLQLNDIAYFGTHKTSTERVVAFGVQKDRPQKEELPLQETVTDQEIDKLLNQVINGY